jgi:porin
MSGDHLPIRGYAPWWQLRPDIQYVFNPTGVIANPNVPTQRVRNELDLDLRTNILF